MLVRKFEAPSLEKALAQVKSEMGRDALVLTTRQKAKKWYQRGSLIEVTAAIMRAPEKKETEPFNKEVLEQVFPHRKAKSKASALRESSLKVEPIEPSGLAKNSAVVTERSREPLARPPQSDALKFESLFQRIGFWAESAKEFSRRIVFDFEREDRSQPGFVAKNLVKWISPHLVVMPLGEIVKKRSILLVGMPGAGKTSVLIRLALLLKRGKEQVAISSLDTRKILGRSELATYAQTVGIPFRPIPSRKDGEVLLIEAPGFEVGAKDLSSLVDLCSGKAVFLVMDSCLRRLEMQKIIKMAKELNPTGLILTRLDLCCQWAVIYEVLKVSNLPLVGFTRSQSFKAGIELATPSELAQLIVNSLDEGVRT